ncbi:MAG TPA: hypothetical protein VGD01_12720 [Candidatus Elarobacter sp.]
MGAERAQLVAALQAALMRAVGEFGADPAVDRHRARLLATAAALDYVLMLASGATGARIPARDAERAIHEGIARAADDLIETATALARGGDPDAVAFARDAAGALRAILRAEALGTDERSFAVIALANA